MKIKKQVSEIIGLAVISRLAAEQDPTDEKDTAH